jgi:fatty acid desaturase
MFRYAEDRFPVAFVLASTAATFAVYFTVDNLWLLLGFWLVMLPARGAMGAWNHHHQHCFTFRSSALNRLLELCYAFQTGMATHLWVLHHVLGHHLNYLDQTKDESRWKRKSGRKMGVIEYILEVSLTSYYRAYVVGKRYPALQRTFLIFSGLTAVVVAGLVWYRPLAGLITFVLPMVTTLLWVSWATYDHHAGLDTQDPWQASYNIENRVYNVVSCNLGYHTAHHYKQGVHWSKLPELHAEIRHKIPEHLFVESSFDTFLPGRS